MLIGNYLLLDYAQGLTRSRVAGDDYYAAFLHCQKIDCLRRERQHFLARPVTIRRPRAIAKIDEIMSWQDSDKFAQHGQAAETGIKNADAHTLFPDYADELSFAALD